MSYEYEYYSLLVNNVDSASANTALHEPPLRFEEVRDIPILKNTEDYEVAIETFKIDTKTLPVFIPTIREGYTTETIYTVAVEFRIPTQEEDNDRQYLSSQNVQFKPQDETLSVPSILENGNIDYSSGYYNIYNFEFFIVLVNNALRMAMNHAVNTLNALTDNSYSDTSCPYFIFDKATGLISLYAPVAGFNRDLGKYATIHLNKPLYRLFNSLPFVLKSATYYDLDADPIIQGVTILLPPVTQQFYSINMQNFGAANVESVDDPPQIDGTTGTTPRNYYVVYQDYSTLDTWTPVDSLVITSNTMPVKSSMRSAQHSYIDGVQTTRGSADGTEFEITDFKAGSYTNGVIYNPSEKRWINMNQRSELKRVNIEVFWRNKLNNALVPLKLNSGGSFSLKFVFRKLRENS
jgi:hypothetical protein